jgi:hypothetical protein
MNHGEATKTVLSDWSVAAKDLYLGHRESERV